MMMAVRIAGMVLCLGVGLAVVCPEVVAADSTAAAPCTFAAGRDVSNNTVTCNFGLTPEQLKEVTEAVRSGETIQLLDRITAISQKLGVTEEAAKTLLRIVGEQTDVPSERLAEVLTKIGDDYKRLQALAAALNLENPTARDLVTQAKADINAGHLDHAHELLRQATRVQVAAAQEADKSIQQAQRARDAQMLGAASSTATEGGLSLTERRYEEAAELFGQAAAFVPARHPNEHSGYLVRRADALYRQGDERGDNTALSKSIEFYHAALEERTHDRVPLDWAETQNDLGNVLIMLGSRKGGVAWLEEGIIAYRAALSERTRDRMPFDWSVTQINLGIALQRLGELKGAPAYIEEAVVAFRAVLAYRSVLEEPITGKTAASIQRASTYINLGIALSSLDLNGSSRWHLQDAVANYRMAVITLLLLPRYQVQDLLASAQMRLGDGLKELGSRESGTTTLEEAVATYREAIAGLKRDWLPLQWALMQTSLGSALTTLGERQIGNERLEEAVGIYREALKELTRDRMPLQWAGAQVSLGRVFLQLGLRSSGTAYLEQAVAAIRASLEELPRDSMPLQWAAAQASLGYVLTILSSRKGWEKTRYLEEAIKAHRAALDELTRDRVPQQWAQTQIYLGDALSELGWRVGSITFLEEAVAAYRGALEETKREQVPLVWAWTQNSLGNVLSRLGAGESGTARLEEAVAAYRAALEESTRSRAPLQWAYSQHGSANALAELAIRLNDPARLKEAIACMRGAIEGYQQTGAGYWQTFAERRVIEMEAKLAEMTP
jgi:tetratricopeptide (TPR) repeat protein